MSLRRYLGLVRAFLVVAGLFLFGTAINTVASMYPLPPNSDGFLQGLAYLYSLILGSAGLLVVQIGYAFPAGIGRFRVGPLADRSISARSSVVVVVYFITAILMVYGVPTVVPSVTESTAYVTSLFVFVIAGVIGLVLTLLLALGSLMIHVYRTQRTRCPTE